MRIRIGLTAALILFGICAAAADVPNLTGVWRLQSDKRGGSPAKEKVSSITLKIEHNEPEFKYDGTILYADERSDHFEFAGTVDGKAYKVGNATVSWKRDSPYVLSSETKLGDGSVNERSRVTISRDGKTLTRWISLKTPQGQKTWEEVYTRQ